MRYVFVVLLALTAAGCVEPPKKDTGPAPLPPHPAGTVSKGEALPPPAKAN